MRTGIRRRIERRPSRERRCCVIIQESIDGAGPDLKEIHFSAFLGPARSMTVRTQYR